MSGAAAPPVQILTADVDRFYRLYDAAGGAPSAASLESDYINAGTQGVREFVPNRILSGDALARRIAADRRVYDNARQCASALPAVRQRIGRALRTLATLLADARFPPVTILIGRDNSGGTAGPSGVLIGLEVVCRPGVRDGGIEDRLVHLIAHEYAHVQQAPHEGPVTVLSQSLREGVAELVAELISGRISNAHLQLWTRGRETELETAFQAAIGETTLTRWLYNGVGTPQQPGDLGYWVGYRIAKAYYDRAPDKRVALRALLDQRDPQAILRDSGWRPGIIL